VRAKVKVRRYLLAALRTDAIRGGLEGFRLTRAGVIKNLAAPVALQEMFPPFNRDERNKKEAQVVV